MYYILHTLIQTHTKYASTFIHTYMHTCIHTLKFGTHLFEPLYHTYIHIHIQAYLHACIHTLKLGTHLFEPLYHTYIHIYIQAYLHTGNTKTWYAPLRTPVSEVFHNHAQRFLFLSRGRKPVLHACMYVCMYT